MKIKLSKPRRLTANRSNGSPRRLRLTTNKAKSSPNAKAFISNARDMLANAYMARAGILQRLIDPRRDIDSECGYVQGEPPIEVYQGLYDRNGIATRVVNVFPDECWSVYPELYEKENSKKKTPLEVKWNDLLDEIPVWHYLHRVDEQSGIGRFGILFLGFDDGLSMDKPVKGINEFGQKVGNAENKLLFVRVFGESLVTVAEFQTDSRNPRYGQPLYYNITFADPKDAAFLSTSGPMKMQTSQRVHWSRCIHIADNRRSSEIFGTPRQRPVLNYITDLRKILGGSGEMFWRGALPGWSLETMPEVLTQLDSDFDADSVRQEMENWANGLQRYLALEGVTAKSLAPQVSDPSSHVGQQLLAICIALGVPTRIFLGSEAAHLASTQDSGTWNRRLARRQANYLDPMVIRPFVNRLMLAGALPTVKSYKTSWTDLNAMSDQDKADVSTKKTQALLQYVTSGAESLVAPIDFLTKFLGFSIDEAEAMLEEAVKNAGDPFTEDVWDKAAPTPSGPAPDPNNVSKRQPRNTQTLPKV